VPVQANKLARPPITPGWDFPDAEIEATVAEGQPLQLSLWLSHRCNLRCTYCFRDAGNDLPGGLELDEYLALIDQAAAMGIRYVFVSGSGEPTLDERLRSVLRHTTDAGLGFVLVTNLTLITDDLAGVLAEHNATVIGKLNSLVPLVQNELAGGIPWAHERILEGLSRLMRAGLNATFPTRLGIETPILPANYDEIPAIYRFARDNNLLPVIELLSNTGRARLLQEVSAEAAHKLFLRLLAIDQENYGYTWIPTPPYAGFQCRRLLYNIVVDSQGYVLPCFGIEERVADVRESSLRAVWDSASLRRNRRIYEHLDGACGQCPLSRKTGCYGCRGRTHVAVGDMFAEDMSCWHARSLVPSCNRTKGP